MENIQEKNSQNRDNSEEIKQLLTENQELLKAIYEQNQKTRKYIMAGRVISFIYLILISAPLIFAAVYLPPLMKNYLAPYQELLGQTQNAEGLNVNAVNDLLNQFQQR